MTKGKTCKVAALQVADEWGFENSATAEAFYKAQQKRLKAQKKKSAAKKYTDPTKRLEKLHKQVSHHHLASTPVPPLRCHWHASN
eukprot:scaffold179182_cov19-Prasinocladus_malaysianus.AAC.1